MPNLHELLTICGTPPYVKVASEQPSEVVDPESREGVYLGYVTKLAAGEEVQGLHALGRFWGILGDLKTASERWEAHNATYEPEDRDFALVADRDGQRIRKYAAFDKESTFRAAGAFYENRDRYPYGWRKTAAEEILRRSDRFGAVLPEGIRTYLVKAAGQAGFTQEGLEGAVRDRYAAMPKAKVEEFTKLAEVLVKVAQDAELRFDPEVVDRVVRALDQFDADIPRGSVKLAEESLEVLTEDLIKVAGDAVSDMVTLQNGRIIKISSLTKEALDAVSPELGGMSNDELRDVLPTLPRPDADLLTRLV